MKNRYLPAMIATVAVLLLVVTLQCSAETVHQNQKYVLKGLGGVGIKIEYYDVGAQKEWWNQTNAAADTAGLFKDFGIMVVGDEQRAGEPGMPFIHIGVHVFERKDPNFIGLYGYAITVSLRETVRLERDFDTIAHAVTWSMAAEGTAAEYRLQSTIDARIQALMQQFVLDYLEANRIRDLIPEIKKRMPAQPVNQRQEYDMNIVDTDQANCQ